MLFVTLVVIVTIMLSWGNGVVASRHLRGRQLVVDIVAAAGTAAPSKRDCEDEEPSNAPSVTPR